mmetsp:Transcript_47171/g.94574  ORF Transcript_47171/g.94574 Transcript_47171/m.94574 type:complete len:111 (+) Transcript_47171:33-365(+)
MLARALRTPLRNAARAVAPPAYRTLSGTPGEHLKEVKDVKLKDVPAWVSETRTDPRTEEAANTWWEQYHKEFIKGGSYMPLFHTIGFCFVCGYSIDYYFHLRHEKNYKYH